MKKRDLVLDFTSLLDVIMIILFIVMSTMGQASSDVQKEAQAQVEDNAEMQQKLKDSQHDLMDLQNEYAEMVANNGELQKQLEDLLEERELYKMDVDEMLLYEELMKKSKKITLICKPYINPNKSDSNEGEVTVYSGDNGEEQEALDVVTFTHNFNLSREERSEKNAQMRENMYRSLENIIGDKDLERVFITIEYTYGDKGFSKIDLDNIMGAVEDIERNYSITCYIDKIKQ